MTLSFAYRAALLMKKLNEMSWDCARTGPQGHQILGARGLFSTPVMQREGGEVRTAFSLSPAALLPTKSCSTRTLFPNLFEGSPSAAHINSTAAPHREACCIIESHVIYLFMVSKYEANLLKGIYRSEPVLRKNQPMKDFQKAKQKQEGGWAHLCGFGLSEELSYSFG